jgi:hypothetical protein
LSCASTNGFRFHLYLGSGVVIIFGSFIGTVIYELFWVGLNEQYFCCCWNPYSYAQIWNPTTSILFHRAKIHEEGYYQPLYSDDNNPFLEEERRKKNTKNSGLHKLLCCAIVQLSVPYLISEWVISETETEFRNAGNVKKRIDLNATLFENKTIRCEG